MSERGEAPRRPPRAPMARRTRKRWAVAAGVAACWALLLYQTGSLIGGTVLLVFLGALGAGCVLALRAMGINGEHPWVQRVRSRPWRDGQDVLRLALRRLPEVFVITPGGTLLAPNSVDLCLNPRDFDSLREVMDLSLVNASAAEVYLEEAEAHGARFARPGPVDVAVLPEPSVPPGRHRLRQARPLAEAAPFPADSEHQLVPAGPPPSAGPYDGPAGQPVSFAPPPADVAAQPASFAPPPAGFAPGAGFAVPPGPGSPAAPPRAPRGPQPGTPQPGAPQPGGPAHAPDAPEPDGGWPFTHDGYTRGAHSPAQPTVTGGGLPTVTERNRPAVPALRVVTAGLVRETRTSGARAGRGEVELALPAVPTVSREHARFTYADGHWWVENLGRNGLTVNGVPLAGQRVVSHGDVIRWGSQPDALESRVEIG